VKTYVFDASALFIFLLKQAGAQKVNVLLKEAMRGHGRILMSAVNYGEVYGSILRQHGLDRALATMSAVKQLPIELIDATPQRAMQASDLKTKYKLYYVDGFADALAMEHKATLVTSDSDFKKLGQGVGVLWL
jgi:PIN domain nuclease of toxin-antitoxin system